MVGISLRFALAAGLHLRNDDPAAMANKKETLVRTWWSLHSIESLLCTIIGRPCIIPNNECTVPLPQIVPKKPIFDSNTPTSRDSTHSSSRGDSDTVTKSSFLGARVTIAIIMQKALAKLYAPQLAVDSWGRVQSDITALLSEIDEWALSARLAGLSPASSLEEPGIERAKLILSFHYHSAKLLICRPCLCRIERRNKGQSDTSADFYQRTADMCVQSAQAITKLLPDQVDLRFIYEQGPWWSIVHHMIQAIAVLLLKMSLGSSHKVHDGEDLSESVKKLTRWLHCMSVSNNVADRACQVVVDIINASAPRVRIDISGITSDNPSLNNTGTTAHSANSRPSLSTPSDSSSSRPSLSMPSDFSSSHPSFSIQSDSASPRPSLSTSGSSNPRLSHDKRIPPLQQPYSTQTSPLALPNNWSPRDPYTTTSTAVSPNTQISTPQDLYNSTATANVIPHTQYTSPQSDQFQHPINTQSMPLQQEDVNMQYPLQQNFDDYPFNPEFSLDGGIQMPSVFGNPFLTNFDHSDVLSSMFGEGSNDGSISDVLGMGISEEFQR